MGHWQSLWTFQVSPSIRVIDSSKYNLTDIRLDRNIIAACITPAVARTQRGQAAAAWLVATPSLQQKYQFLSLR
jgi:hypothetical protein